MIQIRHQNVCSIREQFCNGVPGRVGILEVVERLKKEVVLIGRGAVTQRRHCARIVP